MNPANCLCLKHLATTDSLVVARVSAMLLAILNIQDAHQHPVGNDAAVCRGLAIFLPGNITKTTEVGGVQNLAEGAHEPLINSRDEITLLILEVPSPESCN